MNVCIVTPSVNYYARHTQSDGIELNRNEQHNTTVACNRSRYTKQFFCDDLELTTNKNDQPSVIM